MRRLHKHRLHNQLYDAQENKIDLKLLVTIIGLVIFGLIMVYDASVVQAFKDFGDKYVYIKQQLVWVVLGFIALTFFSYFPFRYLKRFSMLMLFASILLLLAVFIPGLGLEAGGAHRWLKLGPISLQPTEIVKLTSIIFFASIFEKKVRLIPFLTIVGLVSFVIGILQRDLGSTIVYFLTSLAVYIFAGAPLIYFIGLIPVSIIGFLFFVLTSTYRKQRILAFLDPFADPQGFSYHIAQVLIALGSGGLTGLGLGQSRQKFEYIPEVTTDSIFAIVGEEFGFIGAVLLIGLLTFFVLKGLSIADKCSDNFGRLLAFGLTIWLGIQAIINLAAMVSLIPLTGVPLPFISYGGSALMMNLTAVGILLNISKSSKS